MTETTGILAKTGDTEMTERCVLEHLEKDPLDALNMRISIISDEKDLSNGAAAHHYKILVDGEERAAINFQHGPSNVPGSINGVSDASLLAILIDRISSFQEGPFYCFENENVEKCLRLALQYMAQRSIARRVQKVAGQLLPHKSNVSPSYEAWPDMEKGS